MLTSLPPYKHDHPNFVVFCDRTTRQSANRVHSEQVTVEPQDYTSEAWHAAVVLDHPAIFKIPGFSPDNMKTALLDFTRTDTHQFCTTGGGHGSQGVRMNVVFNDDNKKNLCRIEDGIYPEKVAPALLATNILQQACPSNCPLLIAWLQSKVYVDTHFHKNHQDPETREIMIVTGDVSMVAGTHNCYGVFVDKKGWRVGCHFDAFASAGFLAAGHKTFRVCAPSTLTPKRDCNPHVNECYDIDAAFCETVVWYTINLKPGYIMYLPMHWWHQVSHLRFMIDSKNLFIGQYDKLFEEYWLSPISYLSPYRG
jgi:hypothetical protein